jgi:hypothetical protein
MCVLICNGETLAIESSYARATREAKRAARLLNATVTILNLETGGRVQWTN